MRQLKFTWLLITSALVLALLAPVGFVVAPRRAATIRPRSTLASLPSRILTKLLAGFPWGLFGTGKRAPGEPEPSRRGIMGRSRPQRFLGHDDRHREYFRHYNGQQHQGYGYGQPSWSSSSSARAPQWWTAFWKWLTGGQKDPNTPGSPQPPGGGSGGGQAPNGVADTQFEQDCLNSHNRLRALHGVRALTIDSRLTQQARSYAAKLASTGLFEHSHMPGVGENLAYISWGSTTCQFLVQMWYDEIKAYDFRTGGSRGGMIGHFTQLVWDTTSRVGCGKGVSFRGTYLVCQYSPPGNYIGMNTKHVFPPKGRSGGQVGAPRRHHAGRQRVDAPENTSDGRLLA